MLLSILHVDQAWLLEININPALAVNCQTLKDILPGMIHETLGKQPAHEVTQSWGQRYWKIGSVDRFFFWLLLIFTREGSTDRVQLSYKVHYRNEKQATDNVGDLKTAQRKEESSRQRGNQEEKEHLR